MNYYINTFNVPPDSDRYFAIWEIEKTGEKTFSMFPVYKFIKKIHDPLGKFKKFDEYDFGDQVTAEDSRDLIRKLFDTIIETHKRGLKIKT
jgi:hypothetical protein